MPNVRTIPTSQPADVITTTIKINGTAVSREYNVLGMTVKKEVNKIPTAKIVIADGNASTESFEVSDTEDFIPGNEIEVLAGYHSDEETIFKGIIITHGIQIRKGKASILKLECKDEAIKMTVGTRHNLFTEKTDSDVIQEIIGDYNLTVSTDTTDVTHQTLVQHHVTDWDFTVMRAEANGLFVHVNDGEIEIKKPKIEGEGVISVQYGANMLEFNAEMDARTQLASITGNSWDASSQEVITAEATDPGLTEAGNFPSSDLADVIGLENENLIHPGSVLDQELQAWADAALLKSRLAKIRGTVRFQGIGTLKTGDTITLIGVGKRFEGSVWVSGIHHEIGNGNWVTTVQFGMKKEWFAEQFHSSTSTISNLLTTTSGLHTGIVSQIQDDPDGEHRILVKIPILDAEEEGVWARVACLDAGENRGMFFRPEIDDEVILGFLADDPREPVVLGMLNSSAKPAPIEGTDDNHEKGLVTRSEMKFLFDDDKIITKLETPAGKFITLDEDAGVIGIEDENGNKIVLDSNGITIESAADIILKATGDVKTEGVNIESAANANFKAEGSAGLEISSSATTVVKGALVQIN